MTRKDGEFEPDPFDYGHHPTFDELTAEGYIVRKMRVCGEGEWPGLDGTTGQPYYCVMPKGHDGEHNCIPDGLTT